MGRPQRSRQPSPRARHLDPSRVLGKLLGQLVQVSGQTLHPLRRRALLGPEDLGRTLEWGQHVAGQLQAHPPEAATLLDRGQRAHSTVGGGRAADRQDRVFGARISCGQDQLSRSPAARPLRVALLLIQQREPRGPGHLQQRGAGVGEPQPLRLDRASQGVAAIGTAQLSADRLAQHLDRSFPAVCDRALLGPGSGLAQPARHRRRHLGRAEGALEGVRCDQHGHRSARRLAALGGTGPGRQLGQRQRFGRRALEDRPPAQPQLGIDVQKLSPAQHLPAGIVVHALAGDHDQRPLGALLGVNPGGEAAAMLQRLPRLALQHVELVRLGVAKRPQPLRRGEDEVDREQRQARGDPAAGVLYPGTHVAIRQSDLPGEEGEEALRVGLAPRPARCPRPGDPPAQPDPRSPRCGRTGAVSSSKGWVLANVSSPVEAKRM